MNVDLSPELEKLVRSKLKSGRYGSVSEVLREVFQLLDHRDHNFTSGKEEYRQQIEEGWLAARRGELIDGDELFHRIHAELAAVPN